MKLKITAIIISNLSYETNKPGLVLHAFATLSTTLFCMPTTLKHKARPAFACHFETSSTTRFCMLWQQVGLFLGEDFGGWFDSDALIVVLDNVYVCFACFGHFVRSVLAHANTVTVPLRINDDIILFPLHRKI